MVADASIYGLIRQPSPGPGPLESYGQAMQIRNLAGAGELQDIQRAQLQKSIADEAATEAAYRESGGDPVKLRGLLYERGLVKPAMAAEKLGLDTQKTKGEINKTELETFAAATRQIRDLAAGVVDEAGMAQLRDAAKWYEQRFKLPPGKMQVPNLLDPAVKQQFLTTGDEFLKQIEAQKGRATTERGQNMTAATAEAGRATTERGQTMTDTRQREANAVSAATAALKQRELESTIGTKNAAQEQAMASYDTAIATLDRLGGKGKPGDEGYVAPHPGFQAAVGAGLGKTLVPFVGPVPGTNRAGFMRELETFKAQTFLPMVQQLKGMGALSDAEGAKLSAAVGALNEDMGEKEFKASIGRIKTDLAAAKERAARARTRPDTSGKIGGVLTQNPDGSFNYGVGQ